MPSSRYSEIVEHVTAFGTLLQPAGYVEIDVKQAVGIRVLCQAKVGAGGTYQVWYSQDYVHWEQASATTALIVGLSTFYPLKGYLFARVVCVDLPGVPFFDGSADIFISAPLTNDGIGPVTVAGPVQVFGEVSILSFSYTTAVDFAGGLFPIYLGYATPGVLKSASGWQIRKMTYDGANNMTDIQFANGSPGFAFSWDDRTIFTYA